MQRKDHVRTLDLIDPRLFALVPKERMLEALERADADATVSVTLGEACAHAQVHATLRAGHPALKDHEAHAEKAHHWQGAAR